MILFFSKLKIKKLLYLFYKCINVLEIYLINVTEYTVLYMFAY